MPTFILVVSLCFLSSLAEAGEGLATRMNGAQQQRAVYQQQIQQRAIQQKQQQVVQQTIAQKQAALRQAALAQQQMAYQATLQQHQAHIFQQQQQAYQQAAAQQGAHVQEQLARQNQIQQAAYQQAMGAQTDIPFFPSALPVAETVTMEDVWLALESDSQVWAQIMDQEAKEVIVLKYMQDLYQEGVYIKKEPVHYAGLIDQMSFENPEMLVNPFKNILQIVAIMEYDLDNGVDKDVLAKQVLGDQAYQNNLKRIGR